MLRSDECNVISPWDVTARGKPTLGTSHDTRAALTFLTRKQLTNEEHTWNQFTGRPGAKNDSFVFFHQSKSITGEKSVWAPVSKNETKEKHWKKIQMKNNIWWTSASCCLQQVLGRKHTISSLELLGEIICLLTGQNPQWSSPFQFYSSVCFSIVCCCPTVWCDFICATNFAHFNSISPEKKI